MLRTSEVESRATRASLTQLLSPQMGKDIVWFLRRWAKTYLLVDEKLYEQVRDGPLPRLAYTRRTQLLGPGTTLLP